MCNIFAIQLILKFDDIYLQSSYPFLYIVDAWGFDHAFWSWYVVPMGHVRIYKYLLINIVEGRGIMS